MMPGVLLGVAVAALGLGAVWGWQTWSNRVSEPIDDRMPMLVSVEPDAGDVDPGSIPQPAPLRTDDLPPPETAVEAASPTDPPGAGAARAPAEAVVVHVSGAVVSPGVVTLNAGSRVVDALAAAGGAQTAADLDRVNLAALVVDGERIHVPVVGEATAPQLVAPVRGTGAAGTVGVDDDPPVLLDINQATAEAFESLPGIGPSIAQAIVQRRTNRGPFLSIEELLDVPGIGEAKLAQIEPYVFVR